MQLSRSMWYSGFIYLLWVRLGKQISSAFVYWSGVLVNRIANDRDVRVTRLSRLEGGYEVK